VNQKAIKDICKRNGFAFKREGYRQYVITARISEKKHVWECSSLKECKEAIFQAECLKKWQLADPV